MTSHREVERTFDPPADADLPDLTQLDGVLSAETGPELELEATYFDTERLDLMANRVTLRRRIGGSDEGWHLKLPAGMDAREEIHLPLSRARHLPPKAMRDLVLALTAGRELTAGGDDPHPPHRDRSPRRLRRARGGRRRPRRRASDPGRRRAASAVVARVGVRAGRRRLGAARRWRRAPDPGRGRGGLDADQARARPRRRGAGLPRQQGASPGQAGGARAARLPRRTRSSRSWPRTGPYAGARARASTT